MSVDKPARRVFVAPGHSDEAHPEIFNTIPPQTQPLKPGQLTTEQLKQFVEDGYLILESFFNLEELKSAISAIEKLVDDLADKLYGAGKIKDLYTEYGFYERMIKIDNDFPGANIILFKRGVLPEALCDIWSNERALNLAEQILSTADIAGNPVWNLRAKIPNNEATTVPWHQDAAFLDNRAYSTYQLTAWIPLLDVNKQNGCMQVIRKGHKTGRVADHQCCSGNTWYLMMIEDEIKRKLECDPEKDIVTCPIPFGGMLIFNNLVPHRSLINFSDKIRWSLDFRWQRADLDPCFFGLTKPCIRMRSSTDPNFKIDWTDFNSVNRHDEEFVVRKTESEFDTTLAGPWMQKWEIVHSNRHTAALDKDQHESWHGIHVAG